jgi:ABC-2 type transport system permease protein
VPGGIPYLDYLAPGILAQSTLFIAIFYGIQIIWERDAGVLAKLMVTPTPRAALITGKAFAAGVRSIVQAAVIVVLAALLGVYPERLMPGWLQAISKVNPLSYEVSALRGLLIGVPTNLALDTGVLVGSTVAGITVASLLLLPRLAR